MMDKMRECYNATMHECMNVLKQILKFVQINNQILKE